MRDIQKNIYEKLITYNKQILFGFIYLILLVAPLIFLQNLYTSIILSLYLVTYYVYLGHKNSDSIYYFAVLALVMMSIDLFVVYSHMEEGLLRTSLAITTAMSVYGLIIKCVVNLFLVYKKNLTLIRFFSTIRILSIVFIFDAILRTIGLQTGDILTFEDHFPKLIIAIYICEYIYVLLEMKLKK